jgi:hypothetical protein
MNNMKKFLEADSRYTDLCRALIMARHNGDLDITKTLMEEVKDIIENEPNGLMFITSMVNISHALCAAGAVSAGIEFEEMIRMETSIYYEVQSRVQTMIEDM